MIEMLTPGNVTAIGALVVVLYLVASQNPKEREAARQDYLRAAKQQRDDYVASLKMHHDDSKKEMSEARDAFMTAERESRTAFLSALREHTATYERLTVLDHDARHAMANKVGGLAMLMSTHGYPTSEMISKAVEPSE